MRDAFRVKIGERFGDLTHDAVNVGQFESLLERGDGEITTAHRHHDDVRLKQWHWQASAFVLGLAKFVLGLHLRAGRISRGR